VIFSNEKIPSQHHYTKRGLNTKVAGLYKESTKSQKFFLVNSQSSMGIP